MKAVQLKMKIKLSEKLGFNCYIPEKWLNMSS